MTKICDVDTGQVAVGRGTGKLRATAIGSCIVITAFDPLTKIAAMAHVMLPGEAPKKEPDKSKYARNAIERMLEQMSLAGASYGRIQVCLIGAGNVLRRSDDTICEDNISSVTTILNQKRIPIRGSLLGGYTRKSALLEISTGTLFFTEGDRPRTVLYRFADGMEKA